MVEADVEAHDACHSISRARRGNASRGERASARDACDVARATRAVSTVRSSARAALERVGEDGRAQVLDRPPAGRPRASRVTRTPAPASASRDVQRGAVALEVGVRREHDLAHARAPRALDERGERQARGARALDAG